MVEGNVSEHVSDHFTKREARCSCCLSIPLTHWDAITSTARTLERLRERTGGKPIRVSSWYRCRDHPLERRKRYPALHRHCTGRAVDVFVSGLERLAMIEQARACGFVSVGVYSWGLHLDTLKQHEAHWTEKPF